MVFAAHTPRAHLARHARHATNAAVEGVDLQIDTGTSARGERPTVVGARAGVADLTRGAAAVAVATEGGVAHRVDAAAATVGQARVAAGITLAQGADFIWLARVVAHSAVARVARQVDTEPAAVRLADVAGAGASGCACATHTCPTGTAGCTGSRCGSTGSAGSRASDSTRAPRAGGGRPTAHGAGASEARGVIRTAGAEPTEDRYGKRKGAQEGEPNRCVVLHDHRGARGGPKQLKKRFDRGRAHSINCPLGTGCLRSTPCPRTGRHRLRSCRSRWSDRNRRRRSRRGRSTRIRHPRSSPRACR